MSIEAMSHCMRPQHALTRWCCILVQSALARCFSLKSLICAILPLAGCQGNSMLCWSLKQMTQGAAAAAAEACPSSSSHSRRIGSIGQQGHSRPLDMSHCNGSGILPSMPSVELFVRPQKNNFVTIYFGLAIHFRPPGDWCSLVSIAFCMHANIIIRLGN